MGYYLLEFYNKEKHSGNFKSNLLKLAANHFVLSAIVSLIIIITLPSIFNKYKIEIIKLNKIQPHWIYYYADINNDGVSEKIGFHQMRDNFFSLTVFEFGKVFNQWNFDGKFLATAYPMIGSIGKDSLKSIYFLVYKNDKIYLNCLNPLENKFITKNKFVTNYIPTNNEIDIGSYFCTFYDSNNDGIKELYFYLEADYSKQPRNLFQYNPINDSVYRSCKSYADIGASKFIDTTSNDLNIIYSTWATGNSRVEDPYSDMFSWIMIFNKDLSLKYPPIKIGFYPSECGIAPITVDNKKNFIVMNIYKGIKKHSCSLIRFNLKQVVLKKKDFPFSPELEKAFLYKPNNDMKYFYIIKTDGQIEKLNSDFKKLEKISLPPLWSSTPYTFDLEGDRKKELIFQSNDLNKIIITRSNFSDRIEANCSGLGFAEYCAIKLDGKKPRELILTSENEQLALSYKFNPLFYWKYPFYIAIYFSVVMLIIMIEKVQRERTELKYASERKIAELQFKAIKNQIDPHFTFNIINSIGSLFYKQEREKADYIFGKYSKLLRLTIQNSDKIITTIEDELEFVRNYLELEQFRNSNNFNWDIEVKGDVNNNIRVPKMIIHTFVENAIKHGLRHLSKPGELLITYEKNSTAYLIKINDNGVGRNKANNFEFDNTGKGLKILDQILALYYDLMKIRITYYVDDLVDNNGNSLGTEVTIHIPQKAV